EEKLAGQGIAVGVQSGGRQTDEYIAGLHRFAGDELGAVGNAENKPRQIVLAVGVKAGHFGGLAANQRAPVLLAGIGDAGHHFFGDFRLQLAGGKVVHEEHGRGALHRDVVHAVVHQVGADGVVQVHFKGDLQLGTDPVHAGNQNRVRVLFLVDGEEPAKAANLAQHSAIEGLVGEILDALLGAIGALDVYASVGVSNGSGFCRLLCQVSGSSSEGASPQIFTREQALYHSAFWVGWDRCF